MSVLSEVGMSVYIRTKEPIKGAVEYSFNIDTKREECLYIEDGNIVLIRGYRGILFCCSMENIEYIVKGDDIEAESDESFQ